MKLEGLLQLRRSGYTKIQEYEDAFTEIVKDEDTKEEGYEAGGYLFTDNAWDDDTTLKTILKEANILIRHNGKRIGK